MAHPAPAPREFAKPRRGIVHGQVARLGPVSADLSVRFGGIAAEGLSPGDPGQPKQGAAQSAARTLNQHTLFALKPGRLMPPRHHIIGPHTRRFDMDRDISAAGFGQVPGKRLQDNGATAARDDPAVRGPGAHIAGTRQGAPDAIFAPGPAGGSRCTPLAPTKRLKAHGAAILAGVEIRVFPIKSPTEISASNMPRADERRVFPGASVTTPKSVRGLCEQSCDTLALRRRAVLGSLCRAAAHPVFAGPQAQLVRYSARRIAVAART
ncbi:MAG: hypothetical protein HKN63_02745 [Rhodobacteraceae bacterium]|nr:hypothetical protein [Paracoccaceae bacterium]